MIDSRCNYYGIVTKISSIEMEILIFVFVSKNKHIIRILIFDLIAQLQISTLKSVQ